MIAPVSSHEQLLRLLQASAVDFPYQPSRVTPVLRVLPGIRAVVFDFYDTLVLTEPRAVPMGLAPAALLGLTSVQELKKIGAVLPTKAADLETSVRQEIVKEHAHRRAASADLQQPEIDIRKMWQRALKLPEDLPAAAMECLEQAITRWEAWTTRTRPAAGVTAMFAELQARGMLLGIGSNAQFLAHALFAVHFGCVPTKDTFRLQTWSYQIGRGKPDAGFFSHLVAQCSVHALLPSQVLFVGNDPARDIQPAAAAGFATCLFAGDARCLRPAAATSADAVITDFGQLSGLLV